jgi:hypothetical protein
MAGLIYWYNFAMSLSNLSATGEGGVNLTLPCLRALMASASLVSGGGGYATFGTYDSVSGSMAGQFSLSGGFTPLVSGLYHITGNFTFNAGAPSAGNMLFSAGQVGLNKIEMFMPGYIGGVSTPTVSGLIHLTAGVVVYMGGFQTIASPLSASAIAFTAVLVSPV